MPLTTILAAVLAIASAQDAPSRADLAISQAEWNAIDNHLELGGRPLGYTPEQMANYGRDRHALRRFAGVRDTLRFSGRATDLLLDSATHEDELIRHAFAQFLDEGVGRRIPLPGLDERGTSGEIPDAFDPAGESGGWTVDWLEGLTTPQALRRTLEVVKARGVPESLYDLPEPEQRLVTRLLVTIHQPTAYTANAIDRVATARAIESATKQLGQDTGYAVAIAPRLDLKGQPVARGLMDAVGTTDLGYLGHAGVLTAKRVRLAVAEFQRRKPQGASFTEPIAFDTAAGPVFLHGVGPDLLVHDRYPGPALVVDFGGNDRYSGAVAVSDGLRLRPMSLLIDLGGEDTYQPATPPIWKPRDPTDAQSEDRRSPTLATGVFGVGMLWDLGEGDDSYEAFESSMGVGLHGVGVLIDAGGDDTYTVNGSWGQGVGHVGLGVLIDRAGDDAYTAGRNSQAHGSTRGAGVLVDVAGNDRYTIPDDAAPSELYLGRTVAMGQGCGYGRRADLGDSRSMAGGFGVLVDGAGDDHYSAMAWSQGAGYWWGVGILEDRGGNDAYRNGKYSQGAAAHFAVGVHVDLDGNDTYNANPQKMVNPFTGAEQWIPENQYAGHARDGSVGIFVDGAGDDAYVLRANCAGNGDLNSVGFFWDAAGDDTYTGLDIADKPDNPSWTRPPLGTTTRYPEPFRSFRDDLPTHGVFLDSAGEDAYEGVGPDRRNDARWQDRDGGGNGIGIDSGSLGPNARHWQRHESGRWAFTISAKPHDGTRIAAIELDGERVWHTRGSWFEWGFEDSKGTRRGIAEDITGDARPNAVLYHNHGDPRGRSTTHLVFDLRAMRSRAPNARVQELGNGRWEDRDGDGAFEFYERESIRTRRLPMALNAWSQWPEICYTYQLSDGVRHGRYRVDVDRTRRPPMPHDRLAGLIEKYNEAWDGDSPQHIIIGGGIAQMIELLAHGHPDQAWHFWESIRPAIEAIWDYDKTTAELRALIAESPYAPLLRTPGTPSE